MYQNLNDLRKQSCTWANGGISPTEEKNGGPGVEGKYVQADRWLENFLEILR